MVATFLAEGYDRLLSQVNDSRVRPRLLGHLKVNLPRTVRVVTQAVFTVLPINLFNGHLFDLGKLVNFNGKLLLDLAALLDVPT